MSLSSLLLLQNSQNKTQIFTGFGIGTIGSWYGECVFTTSMTGYTESLTDPSYAGQVLCFAYPLIGNYGTSESWYESGQNSNATMGAVGCVMSNYTQNQFHKDKNQTLEEFLLTNNRAGMWGIDTRKLVQILRDQGNQQCVMVVDTAENIQKLQADLLAEKIDFETFCQTVKNTEEIGFIDWATKMGTKEIFEFELENNKVNDKSKNEVKNKTVAVIDCGIKYNILRELKKRFQKVIVVPPTTSFDVIMSHQPNAILLSNGPGDPRDYGYVIATVQELLKTNLPIMGICLGHQMLSLAVGCDAYKMKFGNRGANQPVQNMLTKKAYLSTQNHGYAIVFDSIPAEYELFFQNLNDQSVEGIIHKTKPIFSVQFHPEACAGPQDTNWLFDQFVGSVK